MTDNIITVKGYSQKNRGTQQDLKIVPKFNDALPSVRKYRELAWENYTSRPIPDGSQEDWRRTSLKGIDFSSFKLINPDEFSIDAIPQDHELAGYRD